MDGSGNVYVTGQSIGSGTSNDYCTIKYNSSGVQQWIARYDGPGNSDDWAYSIAVDGSGNVYVTGQSTGSGPGEDYATIKYSQPIGIQPISSELPDEFMLSQNYPNPFNPNTIIRFQIANLSNSKIAIFNALGQEAATLVNEQLKPGSYEVDWNAANFPSGVYYYRLTAGDYSVTKKMILIK